MDIFDLIKGDHRKVESLFAEMESTKSTKKLDQCFKLLCQELTVHAQVEELTFYPTMRDNEETEELVDEAEEEHVEVKVLLEQLKSLDSKSSEFKDKISQLKKAVDHHVQEEENEVLLQVQESMSEEQLNQLAAEFKEAQRKLREELSVATH